MSSRFRTSDFKKLQKTWYLKLKESGFEDAEDTNNKDEVLKQWHCAYFQVRHRPQQFEAQQEYYRQARSFYHRYPFPDQGEKRIWLLHSDGQSLRQISKLMGLKLWFVHRTVEFLESQMTWYLTMFG